MDLGETKKSAGKKGAKGNSTKKSTAEAVEDEGTPAERRLKAKLELVSLVSPSPRRRAEQN